MTAHTTTARKLLLGDGSTPVKLEYFDFEGRGEKVRLALYICGIPFDDIRISVESWPDKKPHMKYGQVPVMTLPDGRTITQSDVMVRLVGEADPSGKLYPQDFEMRYKIDEILGLIDDFLEAYIPSFHIGYCPEQFGHPPREEWDEDELNALAKKLHESFLQNDVHRFMKYFGDMIKDSGGKFLAGEDLTIADVALLPILNFLKSGISEYIPKDCMDPYTEMTEWLERVNANPMIVSYYM